MVFQTPPQAVPGRTRRGDVLCDPGEFLGGVIVQEREGGFQGKLALLFRLFGWPWRVILLWASCTTQFRAGAECPHTCPRFSTGWRSSWHNPLHPPRRLGRDQQATTDFSRSNLARSIPPRRPHKRPALPNPDTAKKREVTPLQTLSIRQIRWLLRRRGGICTNCWPARGASTIHGGPFPRGRSAPFCPRSVASHDHVETDQPVRDLLFGLLALQTGLIDQGCAVHGIHRLDCDRAARWPTISSPAPPRPAQRAAVEAIAAVHIQTHGGDVEKSLAVLAVGRSIRDELCAPVVLTSRRHSATSARRIPRPMPTTMTPTAPPSISVGSATSERPAVPHRSGRMREAAWAPCSWRSTANCTARWR